MAVRKKIKIDKILDGTDLKSIEDHVLEQERLARRAETAQAKIVRKKRGGIFASQNDKSLPSAFVRKQQKQDSLGLSGGRFNHSNEKYRPSEKVRATADESKHSVTDGIMSALGIGNKDKRKFTKDSMISGAGSPIKGHNEFVKLRDKVNKIEYSQESLAKLMTRGQSLVSGAAGLGSINGIVNTGLGFASRIPLIGAIISIATISAYKAWDEYVKQYEDGNTRDKRKKVLASDDSLIGIDNENATYSGTNLFLSNPNNLQGLPRGKSNTQELRDGLERYKQRHQGSYV